MTFFTMAGILARSVGRVLDCKAGVLGFDYQGHTNTQGQK